MDASEIYSKRLDAKEVIFPKEKRIYFSNRRWTNQTPWRRSGTENIHLDTGPPNSRRRSKRFSRRIRRVFHHLTTRFRMPVKRLMTSGPCQETSYTAITLNPESNFTRREKNHSLFPLKYIDVSRTTCTSLDVKQEKRIDDYWNVDGSRDLSDPWTVFTQFTLLEEKPPAGYMWSGGRLTRKQLTSRPDHLWPQIWKTMGKNTKLKEKQKWSNEKLHLENARKLRGVYFIDPEDKEFKETIKNAREKLETSVAPAMPCKILKNNKIKAKLACILEADESTRMRMGNSIPLHHQDHIAGKGEISLQHYNLVHKFIPMPQAVIIPAAKAAVDKEWEKLEKISAWNLTKVRSKKEVIDEARTTGAAVHFASLMDISHLKNAELEATYQKYKGRVVRRGDIVKDDSGSYAVFTEL